MQGQVLYGMHFKKPGTPQACVHVANCGAHGKYTVDEQYMYIVL